MMPRSPISSMLRAVSIASITAPRSGLSSTANGTLPSSLRNAVPSSGRSWSATRSSVFEVLPVEVTAFSGLTIRKRA